MRLAIVRFGILSGGGISRVVECWARMLGNLGHDVTVISKASPKAHSLPPLPGVRALLAKPAASNTRFGRMTAEAGATTRLLRELHEDAPLDAVLSHNSLISARIADVLPDVPLLQTFHSPSVDENHLNNWKYAPNLKRKLTYPATRLIQWRVERDALRAIDHAHTLSDYTWKLLGARYGAECAPIPHTRIPGTVDQTVFAPPEDRTAVRRKLGFADDETILLTVRRLVPRNGVDRILDCAHRMRDDPRPVRFLIGGTGALKASLEAQAQRMQLGDRVQFLGFIPEEDLPLYYQAADAFMMPTRDLECFGLPVIEATACGCPPLVMPDGGPAEICAELPDCVASANTSEGFTDLVRRFLDSRQVPGGQELAAWTRETYSEDAVRPRVAELVESLRKG